MPARVASSEPNRRASDLYFGSDSAKNEAIAFAARRARGARSVSREHAARLASAPMAGQAGRRAIGDASRAEVAMRKTFDELGSAARATADVVAMRVATDLAHRRLLAVGVAMLFAVLPLGAGDPLDRSFVAAQDPHFPLAACVGRVWWAEGSRHAPPNDEPAGRANFSARRAERGAIEGRHDIFAAADEAILFVARAEGAGVSRAEGGGRRVVAGVKAEIDFAAGGRFEEARLAASQEPALGAERGLAHPRRVVRVGAARDERALLGRGVECLRSCERARCRRDHRRGRARIVA